MNLKTEQALRDACRNLCGKNHHPDTPHDPSCERLHDLRYAYRELVRQIQKLEKQWTEAAEKNLLDPEGPRLILAADGLLVISGRMRQLLNMFGDMA